MAVENGALYVQDLNANYPNETDFISEGDDHIRLVKQVLKNTFPNVRTPMTVDPALLNGVTTHFAFESSGSKTISVIGSRIINAAPASQDADIPNLSQVMQLISDKLSSIHPVGSYWISDQPNDDPNTIFGFGQWEKVTGMLMGAGTVFPDNANVPNQVARIFNVNETGGHTSQTIREVNVPELTKDMSTVLTIAATGRHKHELKTRNYRISINDINGSVFGNSEGPDTTNYTEETPDHTHAISGTLTFGRNDVSRQPIDIMPPYKVVNIWRRKL